MGNRYFASALRHEMRQDLAILPELEALLEADRKFGKDKEDSDSKSK